MKSREISRSKTGPFSLACTDPYIGTEWEYQSSLQSSRFRFHEFYIEICTRQLFTNTWGVTHGVQIPKGRNFKLMADVFLIKF